MMTIERARKTAIMKSDYIGYALLVALGVLAAWAATRTPMPFLSR
jgi:heme/copper-type cytochrome/quinol oxidase subunit 4